AARGEGGQLAPSRPPASLLPGRKGPAPVVLGRPRNRRLDGRVPGRGAPARGRGADLEGGPARAREGGLHLPRHRGERLRAPEVVRENGRRALAWGCTPLRDARARAGRAPASRAWARALLARDGGRRRRALRRRLRERNVLVPRARLVGLVTVGLR